MGKNSWPTNAREAREDVLKMITSTTQVTTGIKFSKNIKRLTRENQQKADESLSALLQDNIQSMEDLNDE